MDIGFNFINVPSVPTMVLHFVAAALMFFALREQLMKMKLSSAKWAALFISLLLFGVTIDIA